MEKRAIRQITCGISILATLTMGLLFASPLYATTYQMCNQSYKPCAPVTGFEYGGETFLCAKGASNPTVIGCCDIVDQPHTCDATGGAEFDCGNIYECAVAIKDPAGNVTGCSGCAVIPSTSFGSGNNCSGT